LLFFQMWVRRFYSLLRREQMDEMVGAATNILHELCCFDSDSQHAECIGSIILEEVVSFDTGIDAGLPDHIKLANQNAREALGTKKRRTAVATHSEGRSFFKIISDLMPVRLTTDELEDYTIEFELPDRRVRLRAEAKSAFDSWSTIFADRVPKLRASPSFEGWMWRRKTASDWQQSYALLYDGVLFFFLTIEAADIFKMLAPRDEDSVFLASRFSDDMIYLEHCTVVQHRTWEGQQWVLDFAIENMHDFASVVDEANSDAWTFAVRNARHWFETIPDDHQSRRLFGGVGGEEEGPMIEQHTNPIAERKRHEEQMREEAEGVEKVVDPALAALTANSSKVSQGTNVVTTRFSRVPQSAIDEMCGVVDNSKSGGSGIDGWNVKAPAVVTVAAAIASVEDVKPALMRATSRQPSHAPIRQSSRVALVPADDIRARSVERSNSIDRTPALARVPSLTPASPALAPRSTTPQRAPSITRASTIAATSSPAVSLMRASSLAQPSSTTPKPASAVLNSPALARLTSITRLQGAASPQSATTPLPAVIPAAAASTPAAPAPAPSTPTAAAAGTPALSPAVIRAVTMARSPPPVAPIAVGRALSSAPAASSAPPPTGVTAVRPAGRSTSPSAVKSGGRSSSPAVNNKRASSPVASRPGQRASSPAVGRPSPTAAAANARAPPPAKGPPPSRRAPTSSQ
jgi:hypothetical protein